MRPVFRYFPALSLAITSRHRKFRSFLTLYSTFPVDNELQIGCNQFLRNPAPIAAAAHRMKISGFGTRFNDPEVEPSGEWEEARWRKKEYVP